MAAQHDVGALVRTHAARLRAPCARRSICRAPLRSCASRVTRLDLHVGDAVGRRRVSSISRVSSDLTTRSTLCCRARSICAPGARVSAERTARSERAELRRARASLRCVPCSKPSRGRAFLLFTSHRALRHAADLLVDRCRFRCSCRAPRRGIVLLDRFRASGNGVLLGAASFWEGVDVAGEALSCRRHRQAAVRRAGRSGARSAAGRVARSRRQSVLRLADSRRGDRAQAGRRPPDPRRSPTAACCAVRSAPDLAQSYGKLFLEACRRCRARANSPTCRRSSRDEFTLLHRSTANAARRRRPAHPVATNYGHFTSMRVVDGCVRGLDLHLERLDALDAITVRSARSTSKRVRGWSARCDRGRRRPRCRCASMCFRARYNRERPADAAKPDVLIAVSNAPSESDATVAREIVHLRTRRAAGKARRHFSHFSIIGDSRNKPDSTTRCSSTATVMFPKARSGTWRSSTAKRVVWPDAPQLEGVSKQLLIARASRIAASNASMPRSAVAHRRFPARRSSPIPRSRCVSSHRSTTSRSPPTIVSRRCSLLATIAILHNGSRRFSWRA